MEVGTIRWIICLVLVTANYAEGYKSKELSLKDLINCKNGFYGKVDCYLCGKRVESLDVYQKCCAGHLSHLEFCELYLL